MPPLLLRLAREPLLHFLVIGAALFVVLGRGSGAPTERSEIVVSRAEIARIASSFASTWQRPPSADELKSAIADGLREEVLYRAGLDLGLDRDDTIVRRRIRQKMEFFLEGTVEAPTESELGDFLARNPDRFETDPRIAFRQVFVSAKRNDARQAAEALLPQLVSSGPNAPALGDAMLLPNVFDPTPLRDITSQFGAEFAKALAATRPGVWSGPIASAYGYHLVLVTTVEPARVSSLTAIRPAVEREWYAERRKAVLQSKYEELKSRYVVRVDDGSPQP